MAARGAFGRPSAIIGAAHKWCPDIVVVHLDGGSSYELAQLVRGASPESTVVLWAREEDQMGVLQRASSAARLIAEPVTERLRSELSSQQVHE
jgi:hypothetical protein